MPLPTISQTQLVDTLATSTGYSKSEVRVLLIALGDEIVNAISNCERIRIAGLVTIEPTMKKATKKRMGRNPATGESVEISAKPASVRVKARVMKSLQEQAPSVQKLRRRVAA
jgi:nucleoid DNA-binding protein